MVPEKSVRYNESNKIKSFTTLALRAIGEN